MNHNSIHCMAMLFCRSGGVPHRTNGADVSIFVNCLRPRLALACPVVCTRTQIYASDNSGASFVRLSSIVDPVGQQGLCCATLYILPVGVGEYPKGTLLWAASFGQVRSHRPAVPGGYASYCYAMM